ncbi:gas vesicle protein [Streptomyces reniochalinae]|uniref:Gas vesicle protein n=1 Tax=Streptomyces reniochalinae TaxID=2250578 RepID=A0A367ESM1_9ACTN|nr:gas vesicle protein [Streptomyces reniochalinae]RCG21041.1 gas vesicle protein [Streptomyces reniochalinae]
MTEHTAERPLSHAPSTPSGPANLADILERVLDKGIVIAGDIKIDLLDIELLTIRLRLFVSSVETAKKAGINWWETDPALSTRAHRDAVEDENKRLRQRVAELEAGGPHEEEGPAEAGGESGRGRRRDAGWDESRSHSWHHVKEGQRR